MAHTPRTKLFISMILSLSIAAAAASPASTIIEELNQQPPPDFSSTISNNCLKNPSLRYCNSAAAADLVDVYKSTIVERHLCADSNNTNCPDGFVRIDLRARPKIAPLYLSFTFFWRYCPLTIVAIDLSNNSLKGPFPFDILQCTQIQSLDLRHNELVGEVPIDGLALLANLTFLNLSYNWLSESRSAAALVTLLERFNSSGFLHSGILPDDHRHGLRTTTTAVLLVGVLVSAVSTVGCIGWLVVRRPDYLPSCLRRSRKFTPAMLKAATDGFSPENLVRRNEREEYYRGVLRDGTEVGIRVERGKASSESQKAFEVKCQTLVQLDHKNLARVLGWTNCRGIRAIVVAEQPEAMNVEQWLLRPPPPSWKYRLKVMRRVVEGMWYMQEQWPQVGYDLRTGNVMLGEGNEPLISKLKVGDQSSEARKVYKFGVFSLQLVIGKQRREESERDETVFLEWMRMHYPRNLRKVIDESMKLNSTSYEQLKQTVGIGLACTNSSADHVPRIHQIVTVFRQICTNSSAQTLGLGTHLREHHEGKEHTRPFNQHEHQ